MSYRDDRAASAQRLFDLEARLAGIRHARASLSTLEGEERETLVELDALRRQVAPTAEDIRRRLPMLARVDIASPCSMSWDAMRGDEKKRFCNECQLHVYNLSAMSGPEAESLLMTDDGSLCLRLFRRADGTVLTRDCPVGLRRKSRRRLAAAMVVSATVGGAIMTALASWHEPARQARAVAIEASHMRELGGTLTPQIAPPAPVAQDAGVPFRHHMGVRARPPRDADGVTPRVR